jgi:ferredoxin
MLGYLAKRRIAVELRGRQHCAGCPHGEKGAAQLALNLDGARALAEAAEGEEWLDARFGDGERQRSAHRSARRQLFRRLIGRGADAIAASAAADEAAAVPDSAIRAARSIFTDQRELLRIVGKLPEQAAYRVTAHPALPAMDLEALDGCNACEACFRVCPTGAVTIEESAMAWSLTFDAALCVGCGACLEVCQTGALRAAETVELSERSRRRPLQQRSKQRCTRCDRHFVSAGSQALCSVCTDDEGAFAELFG